MSIFTPVVCVALEALAIWHMWPRPARLHSLTACPRCNASPFDQFLPGSFYSPLRRLLGLPYSTVICRGCKEIVGHEQ